MAIKKYHVSKNLLEDVITGANIAANGSIAVTPDYNIWVAKVTAGETYRANNVNGTYGFYTEKPTISSITYNNSRELFSGDSPTIVVPQGISYIGIRATVAATNVMLNTGSTAEPYEPYDPEVWHTIPYKRYETSTDTLTTLPAEVIADGNNATVGLVGNMAQTGTPTPQNPIEPSECGERTGNLFDIAKNPLEQGSIDGIDGLDMQSTTRVRINGYITLTQGEYTMLAQAQDALKAYIFIYDLNNNYEQRIPGSWSTLPITFTLQATKKIRIIYAYKSEAIINPSHISNIMLNTGSTSLPYEPYGIKIPILSGGTTTPVYLGEVQSTRQIFKVVFNGTENWTEYGSGSGRFFYTSLSTQGYNDSKLVMSTHFQYTVGSSAAYSISLASNGTVLRIYDRETNWADATTFKTWVAAQYSAGTPVYVWYVLATPQTAIVNEPIRKIGDYADTVSGISVPTLGTSEQFDVDTTLKPSEVQLTYTGWHNKSDTKF